MPNTIWQQAWTSGSGRRHRQRSPRWISTPRRSPWSSATRWLWRGASRPARHPALSCRASRDGASGPGIRCPLATTGQRLAGPCRCPWSARRIPPLPIHLAEHGDATLTLYPRGQVKASRSGRSSTAPGWFTLPIGSVIMTQGRTWTARRGWTFCVAVRRSRTPAVSACGASVREAGSAAPLPPSTRIGRGGRSTRPCNFPLAAQVTTAPYVELHDYLAQHPEQRDQALATLTYFDQLHLAEATTCPTLIASAITDEVHPLRTVMPVFEKIRALKSIIVDPDLEHEYRTDFTTHAKAWIDRDPR